MIYELIIAPNLEPFTLAELKEALRIDHDSDDDLVVKLAQTARRQIERRLSYAIADQTWQVTATPKDGQSLILRPGHVKTIVSVDLRYGDSGYTPLAEWKLVRTWPACLEILAPSLQSGESLEEIRVQFTSGVSDMADVPLDLVQAITMLTAHYYENREAVQEGRYVSMPMGVESLLQGFREIQL